MTKSKTMVVQPTMHTKFKGDAESLARKLQRAGIYLAQKNHTRRGRHQLMAIADMTPLESQRNVTENWIVKVLKMAQGFDWIAAGLVFVARDPVTGINYVWDGCGRLALAEASGITHLDVWVLEMTTQEAAHYFVHVQKTAKRGLDASIIFCNAYACGDPDAIAMAGLLDRLGVRVQGADDVTVPAVPEASRHLYPRVKLRSIEQSLKYAQRRGAEAQLQVSNEDLIRFARDTIVQAGWTDDEIRQDLLPGLVIFYSCFPEAMRNGLATAIRNWFQNLSGTTKQARLPFKELGGNIHNREPESVALGIVKAFRGSPLCNKGKELVIQPKRIKQYIDFLANKAIDDDDSDDIE